MTNQQKLSVKILKKKIEKQAGGALLMNGLFYDYEYKLIDHDTMLYRASLVPDFESGKITLQELNRNW